MAVGDRSREHGAGEARAGRSDLGPDEGEQAQEHGCAPPVGDRDQPATEEELGGRWTEASASAPVLGGGSQPETTTWDAQASHLTGKLGGSGSRAEPSIGTIKEASEDGERRESTATIINLSKTEADRLFEQLQGKATWKLSDFQVARQVAWERERHKFQQRMKKIMKSKAHTNNSAAGSSSVDEHGQPLGGDHRYRQQSGIVSAETSSDSFADNQDGGGMLNGDASLLPVLENPAQELPFHDKDNWSVGSLNRERQMYAHLHHENVRRSQKSLTPTTTSRSNGGGSRLRRNSVQALEQQIDLAPSAFLLEKLGSSCVVVENLPPKQKQRTTGPHQRKSSLLSNTRLTQLTPALSSNSRGAIAGSTDGHEDPGDDASEHATAAAPLTPHHSMRQLIKQYDQLLQQQEAEEEQLRRASRLLTRAVTVKKTPPTSQQQHEEQHHPEDESTTQKPLKKVSSAPSNRRQPSSVGRPVSSAKAKRTKGDTARSTKDPLVPETTAAKKLRMRSDAALLRQDHFGPHSRDDVVNIYRTFQKIDRDQSGTITLRELVDGSGLFASTHLQDNVMSIFSSIDKDQSGQIDLPELLTAIFGGSSSSSEDAGTLQDIFRLCKLLEAAEKAKKAAAKKQQLSPEQIKELYALFTLYDLDHDGNIDADELFSALRYNDKFYDSSSRGGATQVTREDVAKIIAHFDVNTNATLDIGEFIELFRDDS